MRSVAPTAQNHRRLHSKLPGPRLPLRLGDSEGTLRLPPSCLCGSGRRGSPRAPVLMSFPPLGLF